MKSDDELIALAIQSGKLTKCKPGEESAKPKHQMSRPRTKKERLHMGIVAANRYMKKRISDND
jgi:hypothetical protein